MDKKEYYVVYVLGKNSPTRFHESLELAEREATRLAREEKQTVYVFKAVSIFELSDVVKTDLT